MDLESTYGMGGDRSLSPARIRVRARRVLRLDGRRPASGPVTVDTLAPEDFNESSIPQVYEPIYILYQYVSVCIASDRYRGFFLSTKMYVLAGIRTYLVIYARICLASFGLPDSGAVKPTALRAYRKLWLSCWPAAY